ncbi:hypothetical protein D9V32_12730 [Mycetocola tolaasinivorans]|uniref:Uncharacterized protein n=1 Tax=Mycetocola tolaasinivorans TaxID=76635 RepID=A0A3L7A3M9_9MICO|nr:hypothetical protein [Mycetocola tolaasinivorans]RLP74548.1 hypothetical protein D9V32_12730 [Mycetocola tolaasinivorans]
MSEVWSDRSLARVLRAESARVWHSRAARWVLGLSALGASIAAIVPALMGGVIALDAPAPADLRLDDPNVVRSLYLAGAGIAALPALVWGVVIGSPRGPSVPRHAEAVAAAAAAPAYHQAHAGPGPAPRRGSGADMAMLRRAGAERAVERRAATIRARWRSARVADRVSGAADPVVVACARALVAGGAGVVLGAVLLVAGVLGSAVVLTIFGASLGLTEEHTLVLGARMVLASGLLVVTGAGLGAVLRFSRPLALVIVGVVVVVADAVVRVGVTAGFLPVSALRYVPSVVVRAASGVAGAGFPPPTPIAVTGMRALGLLLLLSLLSTAGATVRAAMIARRQQSTAVFPVAE